MSSQQSRWPVHEVNVDVETNFLRQLIKLIFGIPTAPGT